MITSTIGTDDHKSLQESITYIHTYIHKHIHTYIYTNIYAYIHTYIKSYLIDRTQMVICGDTRSPWVLVKY